MIKEQFKTELKKHDRLSVLTSLVYSDSKVDILQRIIDQRFIKTMKKFNYIGHHRMILILNAL